MSAVPFNIYQTHARLFAEAGYNPQTDQLGLVLYGEPDVIHIFEGVAYELYDTLDVYHRVYIDRTTVDVLDRAFDGSTSHRTDDAAKYRAPLYHFLTGNGEEVTSVLKMARSAKVPDVHIHGAHIDFATGRVTIALQDPTESFFWSPSLKKRLGQKVPQFRHEHKPVAPDALFLVETEELDAVAVLLHQSVPLREIDAAIPYMELLMGSYDNGAAAQSRERVGKAIAQLSAGARL